MGYTKTILGRASETVWGKIRIGRMTGPSARSPELCAHWTSLLVLALVNPSALALGLFVYGVYF